MPARLRRAAAGFTLLEVLLVLLLLGLLAAWVWPSTARSIDAARERSAMRLLRDTVEGLPQAAFLQGEALAVDTLALRQRLGPRWPEDWRVALPRPLRYNEVGVAEGGALVVMVADEQARTWQVEPVTGRLHAEPVPASPSPDRP